MKTILIKIGTNALTDANGRLDYGVIKNLVKQMAELHQQGYGQVLVTSGAVGSGKEVIKIREKNPIRAKQMYAAIGQSRLMNVYNQEFAKYKIIVAQALLMRSDFADRQKYLNIKDTLIGLLAHHVIPIINENDVVATTELDTSDNDTLATLTASMIEAQKIIMLSNIEGFYTADPRENKKAELIQEVKKITPEFEKMCGSKVSAGGRGGFLTKLRAAKFATQIGIEFYVVNGKRKNILLDIIKGDFVGTKFAPQAKKVGGFRQWLLLGARGGGAVQIDAGAFQALQNKKSLLAVGVKKILGEFKDREVINIFDEKMLKVAAGVVNYNSKELQSALEKKDKKNLKEVVHCDNIVIF